MTNDPERQGSRSPWSQFEIDAAVAAYAEMLDAERRGERYSKLALNQRVDALTGRGHGSIERKFQNISAILQDEGRSWINGYKPLSNWQYQLRATVLNVLGPGGRLAESLETYADIAIAAPQPRRLATEDVLIPVPGVDPPRTRASMGIVGGSIDAMHDFQRRQLGAAGEQWVIDLERERLRRLGRDDLGERIEWVSRTQGDSAGYDVASFWPDGRRRLIEVKTTNYGSKTPFYITRGEIETSRTNAPVYSLYRVHAFAREPRIYILDGSVAELARLEPKVFLGLPL